MLHIRELAPTIIHALRAVEMGCRKVQEEHNFVIKMTTWLTVSDGMCFGCLATCSLLHLSNKSSNEVTNRFSPNAPTPFKSITDRVYAYNIAKDEHDLEEFEQAIDLLRHNDLFRLLNFYGYKHHPNADIAMEWLINNRKEKLLEDCSKREVLQYADFLRDELIPRMKNWFGVAE